MTSLKYSIQSEQKLDKTDQFNQNNKQINNRLIKQLTNKLNQYQNSQQITLQQSIPILYNINIFQQLISIDDAKRRLAQDNKLNQRLQLQARFIYTLWKLIDQEFIQIEFLKSIVMLFMTEQGAELASQLQSIFLNQPDLIIQLLAIWEGMLENRQFCNTFSQNFQSVLTQKDITHSNLNHNTYQRPSKSIKKEGYSTYRNQSRNNSKKQVEEHYKSQFQSKKGGKQNQQYWHSRNSHSNNHTQRHSNLTRRQNMQQIRNQIYNSQFYQIPTLTVDKQKQLVNRLYVVNKYDRYIELKKIQDEQKMQKQLQQCTFQPKIDKNKKRCYTSNMYSQKKQGKKIPGFEKVIERMKIGQQKSKQLKQQLQFRNINIKPQKQQQKNTKVIAPPKFLNRQKKKQQKKTLFTIQFDIGRHKITCKIHENESAEQLARNIQSIYSLKQDSFEQIKEIIQQQMQRYYSLLQNENNDCGQQKEQEKIIQNKTQNSFIFF